MSRTLLTLRKIHLLEITLQILVLTGKYPLDLDDSLREVTLAREATLALEDGFHLTPARWTVFKDWFHYLLHHEHFWEAQRILQSLFNVLPSVQCLDLLQDCIAKAVGTNIGQESVKIAISSLVQQFVYFFQSSGSILREAAPWNDAITWAIFGEVLVKAGAEFTSLFSRICLRRSLQDDLKLSMNLPLDGHNGNDEMSRRLFEAITSGDMRTMQQAMTAEPTRYPLDGLSSGVLLNAAQSNSRIDMLPFLNSRTVNSRDGFWRTPLHWAVLNDEWKAVELLLSEEKADAGLLDWFGNTPLHCAVRPWAPGSASETKRVRVTAALLKSDSTRINMKSPRGQTPLSTVIRSQSYDIAEILLQHGAVFTAGDYDALSQFDPWKRDKWRQLLSKWRRLRWNYDPSLQLDSPHRSSLDEWYDHTRSTTTGSSSYYPAVNPADHNPPCHILFVDGLSSDTPEDQLEAVFSDWIGYKRLIYKEEPKGPVCWVVFEDIASATRALDGLYDHPQIELLMFAKIPPPTNRHAREELATIENKDKGRRLEVEKVKNERMWTEITKELVTENAIRMLGYEFEETKDFYYVMEYLRYVSPYLLPPSTSSSNPPIYCCFIGGRAQACRTYRCHQT